MDTQPIAGDNHRTGTRILLRRSSEDGIVDIRQLAVIALIGSLALPALGRPSNDSQKAKTSKEKREKTDKKANHGESKKVVHQTIVVTATRSERIAADVPVSMTVLSEKEVQTTPARQIDDVLRTIPGVTMALGSTRFTPPSMNNFSMRGVGEGRSLALLDGIPLNDPYTGQIQWRKVTGEDISQVEVVRGASASLFGNWALGGTINVLTRPSTDGHSTLDLSAGTYGTTRAHFRLDHHFSDDLAVGLSLTNTASNGYNDTLASARGLIDVGANYHTTNASVRTDWFPTANVRTWGRVGYLHDYTRLNTPTAGYGADIFDASGGGQFVLGTNYVTATAFYQNNDPWIATSRSSATRSSETPASRNNARVNDRGATIQWTRSLGTTLPQVSLGVDLLSIGIHNIRNNLASDGSVALVQDLHAQQQFVGVFGLVSWMPVSRLEILASGRLDDYENTSAVEKRSDGQVDEFPSTRKTRFDPRLSVRFAVSDALALRAATYGAFRAPTPQDLYQQRSAGRSDRVANPFLQPETLRGGEIGATLGRGAFRAEINLFRNDIDGIMTDVTLATSPRLVRQTQNVGSAKSQGLEVMSTWRATPHLLVVSSYTLTDSKITSNPDDPTLVGKEIPDIPRNAGSLQVRYIGPSGFVVSIRGRAESKRFFDDQNTETQGGVPIFDLYTSWPVRGNAELYATAENIFDRVYIVNRSARPLIGAPFELNAGVRLHLGAVGP